MWPVPTPFIATAGSGGSFVVTLKNPLEVLLRHVDTPFDIFWLTCDPTDEPLEGHVSGIDEKSAGSTEFTLRLPKARLDELSDDRDDYKSGLVG